MRLTDIRLERNYIDAIARIEGTSLKAINEDDDDNENNKNNKDNKDGSTKEEDEFEEAREIDNLSDSNYSPSPR